MTRVMDKAELKPCLEMGFDLIPIRKWDSVRKGKPSGKMPRDNEWVVARYTKPAIIEWIKQGGNLGVRLSAEQLVIDVDPKHEDARGRSASDILDDLELELGIDVSDAPTVETGSGGLHVYLSKPVDQRVKNTIELFGGAIEFKSSGRQVLAPGCKHPNGNFYRWVRNAGGPLNPCPVELWDLIAKPVAESKPRGEGDVLTIKQIKRCLEQLDPANFRDYDTWRNILFSVHYASAGDLDARDLFVRWSTSDPEYREAGEAIEDFWDHADEARGDARTEKTLFYYVLQSGGSVPLDLDLLDDVEQPEDASGEEHRPLPVFDRNKDARIKHTVAENVIRAFDYLGMGVLEDVFSGKKHVIDTRGALRKHFDIEQGSEFNDVVRSKMVLSVTREIQTWAGDPSRSTMELVVPAVTREVHPVQKYLNGLAWDGKRRSETWLIDTSGLADTPYNRAVSRLWLYAAVGRVMKPGIKFDTMIILEGPQGGMKSTLIKWLAGDWAAEGLPPIHAHNQQNVVSAMRGCWLVEIDELASMKKTDVDELKSFVSRTEDRVRMPYERETRTFPRQCVFIGTTNDREYLRDMTGNRRFLPMDVGTIRNVFQIPRDQLWAEAVHDWKRKPADKEIHLPRNLWAFASQMQEERRVRDPWEDRIEEMVNEKWTDETELSTDTLFFECLQMKMAGSDSRHTRRLAQVMRKLGWEATKLKENGRQVRGYRKKETP